MSALSADRRDDTLKERTLRAINEARAEGKDLLLIRLDNTDPLKLTFAEFDARVGFGPIGEDLADG